MAFQLKLIPEVVYFATYMAINDRRLYDREWFRINRLIDTAGFGPEVRSTAVAIIQDHADKPLLDDIIDTLCSAPDETKEFTLYFGLLIAYEDGTFRDKEEVLFSRLCKRFRVEKKRYAKIQQDARNEVIGGNARDENAKAGFLRELNTRYNGALFEGEQYDSVVKQMQKVAKEDLEVSTNCIEKSAELFLVAPKILKDQQEKVLRYEGRLNDSEEKKQLENLFSSLRDKEEAMLKQADESLTMLKNKQTAASAYYTVSFMGRTKAGKSTLHSVLLGGINYEFIGVGSERTTRYNYVYDWNGIRIIDTPGIGAPGGEDDVEIAEDVADESDLICYVVTSDSIQETEFNFLKKLKDRNKPVIILLNKKDNFLRSSKKKEAFLANPLDWYTREGEDSISGHLNRIHTYVSKNHEFHNYRVVPVHLLAAKTALGETDPEAKRRLMEGSRIQEFLSALSDMIQSNGVIMRSQTIYNAAVYHMECNEMSIRDQINALNAFIKVLDKNRSKVMMKLKKAAKDRKTELASAIEATYEAFITDEVQRFVNTHYAESKSEINSSWKKFLGEGRLKEYIENDYERIWNAYNNQVEDILLEVEEDMAFSVEFGELATVDTGTLFDIRGGTEIGGALLGVGAIVAFALGSNPVGWVLLGVAMAAGVASYFMKSKSRQLGEKKSKIYDSIKRNMEEMRAENIREVTEKFDTTHKKIIGKIGRYYGIIINGLDELRSTLSDTLTDQVEYVDILNRRYAGRILNYMAQEEMIDILNEADLSKVEVVREFRKEIVITGPAVKDFTPVFSPGQISEILQEEVRIGDKGEGYEE
ncbi:MAG: 50S ribosome-binding GTPase [Lachnospiraceae bacterium]|nr:50S ribosome-binding GTPase [Lachnospiraceae bacterium]